MQQYHNQCPLTLSWRVFLLMEETCLITTQPRVQVCWFHNYFFLLTSVLGFDFRLLCELRLWPPQDLVQGHPCLQLETSDGLNKSSVAVLPGDGMIERMRQITYTRLVHLYLPY